MKTAYQNLWDTAKAMLRENFVALNENIKNKKHTKPVIQVSVLRR